MSKKKKNTPFAEISPQLRTDALELFVVGAKTPMEIQSWMLREHHIQVSREWVYKKLLPWAHEAEIFRLLLPPEFRFSRMLAEEFGQDPSRILVVNAPKRIRRQHIATTTAALIVKLILEVWEQKDVVHVGLGGGLTVKEVCRELAVALAAELALPKLVFHALSSGFDVDDPTSAPISFMALLQQAKIRAEMEFIGLFARPFVGIKHYDEVRKSLGVQRSIKEAKDIDIVITGCATAADLHGALARFAQVSKTNFAKNELLKQGWVGDLQYQPFSNDGPLDIKRGMRAFALLGIKELEKLVARKHKHVVVVAAPCGTCFVPKVAAVRPLLACPKLAVWTHLVTDIRTADELLSKRKLGRRPIYV